ncbi:MAG: Fe2+-dependent dioxygenase [Ponticaulis sp.]|nr:Fe2+-dependent dioxygenase [Ponticaulis sp.]|tara:strand:- start:10329 stop:11003 length:675 start_codon:yes stop_codon:yes gene_type:complete
MPLLIGEVLSPEMLASAQERLKLLVWEDGTRTAGSVARMVKQNKQADLTTRAGARLKEILTEVVTSHAVVRSFARPKKWSRLLVSRTEAGGGYGLHIDNALMGKGDAEVRTDLSFTLFLSDPETYEGGELQIEQSGQTHSVKAAAGDMVIYPSDTLHQVTPVTSGTRYVCVGWIQSRIRGEDQRTILYDLDNLKAELGRTHDVNSPEMLTLSKTSANLLRMWAE